MSGKLSSLTGGAFEPARPISITWNSLMKFKHGTFQWPFLLFKTLLLNDEYEKYSIEKELDKLKAKVHQRLLWVWFMSLF